MGNSQKKRPVYNYDYYSEYDSDYDYEYVRDLRPRGRTVTVEGSRPPREDPRDEIYGAVDRTRRYEDEDPDEYAMVPAKPKMPVRSYDEPIRKAIMSPQDMQEREMSQLKMEEQKIKNKIASERLSYDIQKREQSKELHDIKVAVIKKYPSVLLNKQSAE